MFANYRDELSANYKLIFRLRLLAHAHYEKEYEKVIGYQFFPNKLVREEFQRQEKAQHKSRTHLEWIYSLLINAKSLQLDEVPTDTEQKRLYCEKLKKKTARIWELMFKTPLPDNPVAQSIQVLEHKIIDRIYIQDKKKYFISTNSSTSKTKPLSTSELDELIQKVENLPEPNPVELRILSETLYENPDELQLQLETIKNDISLLRTRLPLSKQLVEVKPFILTYTDAKLLQQCVNFIHRACDCLD